MYNKSLFKGLVASGVVALAITGTVCMVNFSKSSKANDEKKEYDIASICDEISEEVEENMSSNPYDYIRVSCKYRKLLSLGKDALPKMEQYIEDNGGLEGYIVALAMEDIENCTMYEETNIDWANSQEFLRAWRVYKRKNNYNFNITRSNPFDTKNIENDKKQEKEIKYDYSRFYKKIICRDCEKAKYDPNQLDSFKHKRMYGIKFCQYHQKNTSEEAEFVEQGYTDYNCLAYALGDIQPCNWMWPSSWGDHPNVDVVKDYFEKNGYTTEAYNKKDEMKYKDKKSIYVYAVKNDKEDDKKYEVVHFGRTDQVDGSDIGDYAEVSKWGMGAIYKTKNVNGFTPKSGYGECVLVCYK